MTSEDESEQHMLNALTEFIETFDASRDPELWIKLITEEAKELLESEPGSENELKEAIDFSYVMTGLVVVTNNGENDPNPREPSRYARLILEGAAELASDMWGDYGDEVMLKAFDRVHGSNMSKLGNDGKPIRREDGKIMKGPNYKPADLSDLVKEEAH